MLLQQPPNTCPLSALAARLMDKGYSLMVIKNKHETICICNASPTLTSPNARPYVCAQN